MMDIMPPSGYLPMIAAYGGGAFRVLEQSYPQSLFLSMQGIIPIEGEMTPNASVIGETLDTYLAMLGDTKLEILLIGTGETTVFMHPTTRVALRARGIAVDVMDTGAACRTFNVLLGEGRQVAALLVVV